MSRFTVVPNADSNFEMMEVHPYDEAARQNEADIKEWAYRLDACKGEIPCQLLSDALQQWTTRRMADAGEDKDYAEEDLIKRPNWHAANFSLPYIITRHWDQMVQDASNGQCINCHHYRNYTTHNMQFHARQFKGGTIMVIDGELRKVNLKTDSTISAGVYPAWHPTHDYIAYSTNKTHQSIRSIDHNRVEVADEESDLILYDIRNNSVSIIENDSSQFECFPSWSPDGRMLYYVSAYYDAPFGEKRKDQVFINSKDIKYDLYCKPFDPDTRTWGESVLLYDCSAQGMSATLPRVSPDGRMLLFSMAPYGVFHIWHRESDLWMMDLKDNSVRKLDEINSPEVESYHSWSSNGKWVIFSTRREDGAYTRLYITHLEKDGSFSKPFALPQRNPDFNKSFLYSYNIPEFMKEPVHISPQQFASFISNIDATPSSYESKRGK